MVVEALLLLFLLAIGFPFLWKYCVWKQRGKMAKSDGIAEAWGVGSGGVETNQPKAPVRKMAKSDGIAKVW